MSATILRDGRVLLINAYLNEPDGVTTPRSADPIAESLTLVSAGSYTGEREPGTTTLLPDGRVLVIGGFGGGDEYVRLGLCLGPAVLSFSPAGTLADARTQHGAALLQDGRVLVVGGIGPGGVLASAEVWQP